MTSRINKLTGWINSFDEPEARHMDFMKFFKALSHAMLLVEEAVTRFGDNTERREWVVRQLMDRLHINESLARAAVELAVLITKHQKA